MSRVLQYFHDTVRAQPDQMAASASVSVTGNIRLAITAISCGQKGAEHIHNDNGA